MIIHVVVHRDEVPPEGEVQGEFLRHAEVILEVDVRDGQAGGRRRIHDVAAQARRQAEQVVRQTCSAARAAAQGVVRATGAVALVERIRSGLIVVGVCHGRLQAPVISAETERVLSANECDVVNDIIGVREAYRVRASRRSGLLPIAHALIAVDGHLRYAGSVRKRRDVAVRNSECGVLVRPQVVAEVEGVEPVKPEAEFVQGIGGEEMGVTSDIIVVPGRGVFANVDELSRSGSG